MSTFFSHPKLFELRTGSALRPRSWTVYFSGPAQGFIACEEELVEEGMRQVLGSIVLPTRHEVERFLAKLMASGWSLRSSKS